MEEKNLESLRRDFILDREAEQEDIGNLTTRILRFCKIDKQGYVVLSDRGAKIPTKILLVLSARYIGSKLQQKTGDSVTINESIHYKDLAKMLREKEAVIAARLKELKDERVVASVSPGIYRIEPYALDKFLMELEGVTNG